MVAKGIVLSDSFKLNGETLKCSKVKRSGYGPSTALYCCMLLDENNAVMFRGVEDDDTDGELQYTFYNNVFAFSLDRIPLFPLTVRCNVTR